MTLRGSFFNYNNLVDYLVSFEDLQETNKTLNIVAHVGKRVVHGVSHSSLGCHVHNRGKVKLLEQVRQEELVACIPSVHADPCLDELVSSVLLQLDVIVLGEGVHSHNAGLPLANEAKGDVEPYKTSCSCHQYHLLMVVGRRWVVVDSLREISYDIITESRSCLIISCVY